MTDPVETLRRAVTGGGTMGELILGATSRFPDRAAFVYGGTALSYRELGELIVQGRRALAGLGLAPDAVVAQLTSNRPEAFALQAAAYLAGHPSLMLHPSTSLSDLVTVLHDARAQLLVVDAHGAIAEAADAIRSGVPGIRVVAHEAGSPLLDVWSLAATQEGSCRRVPADAVARLSYTGGTTGRSKGVVLSHRAMVAATVLAAAELDWPAELRFLVATPISHAGGTLVPSVLLKGGTVHLGERFDATTFLDEIREQRITATFVVPTMIGRLLDGLAGRSADVPTLQMLLYGGAPMSVDRIRAAIES
ncbi:MAG: fatty-acyl-CoA synthase, partial [Pseudonocardiales bacterium]|nr:fatty-acyl-CoA synthase [Pseudonocardiales bacterium]